MFSKEEAKQIREEFWESFGKSFPKKWILYNTKIKDFSFKFYFDNKKAMVLLDIEHDDIENRIRYFEKIISLKNILLTEYLPNAIFEKNYCLDNQKEISRIYVLLENVCIYNKNTWAETMDFFYKKMVCFELFWEEYEEFIKD